jgi:23S rRNA (guanosine2251-2'-O)-methyltransferase
MRDIILIAHNLRSCHNVGSLLRTAEGLGVAKVMLTGYTPYPVKGGDTRLPHLAAKLHRQIQKTALGAEESQPWEYYENLEPVLADVRTKGYATAAVEQAPHAIPLPEYNPPQKIALLVGREVEGVESEILQQMDAVLEIPMFGKKESFNVVQAAAMTLYHCTFWQKIR